MAEIKQKNILRCPGTTNNGHSYLEAYILIYQLWNRKDTTTLAKIQKWTTAISKDGM